MGVLALAGAACDRCAPAEPPSASSAPVSSARFAAEPQLGEIDGDGLVLWARGSEAAELVVRVGGVERRATFDPGDDLTARVVIEGLPAGTHPWRAQVGSDVREGRVRLAPPENAAAAVSFAWTGDVAGQNVCRDTELGFLLLGEIDVSRYDFTLALGDWIYADDTCEPVGRYGNAQVPGGFARAADLEGFRAHWRYAEADRGYAAFRARTYVVWDDHEVENDFGSAAPLYALGRRAFLERAPLPIEPSDVETPLWRSVRWGRHLELLLLDTRSFRDDNEAPDDPSAPKTMLGAAQRAWLEERLRESNATHLVVVSSVPLAVPTGWPRERGRDGWADAEGPTGFEEELVAVLRVARDAGRRRLVFVTTDVHFAEAVRYRPFDDAPGFEVLELLAGPASAGLFPNRELDPTLRPESLFFHGPETIDSVRTVEEARRWNNWGAITVDERGSLRAEIRDERSVLWSLDLAP